LAYTQLEKLRPSEKIRIACDLGIAALIGETVYNFGELLEHPILQSLEGTQYKWLAEVIKAFSTGNIDLYLQLCKTYSEELNNQQDLVSNQQLMSQKISILSLIELVFNKPSDDRTVSFETISKVSKFPVGEVELLVMKAQSLGLIRGVIDQVTQTVAISWVQPRILNLEQIAKMNERLKTWGGNVKTALVLLENQTTPELIE